MSEEKTTSENFLEVCNGLDHVAKYLQSLSSGIRRDAEEIRKLNGIIDELRDEIEQLKKGGEA